jgi:predicted dehydrogenase
MSKFNVAIIGVGKRGRTIYNEIKSNPNVNLIACCDTEAPSFKISVPLYLSYEEMISKHAEINGLIIATPVSTHFKIASYLLKKNKHILIEKPFVISVRESERLVSLAKQKKLACVVGYHILYNNLIKKLEIIVKSGSLGQITMIRGRQAHDWGGDKPKSWHVNKLVSGGGTLIDNSSHYLDLITNIFGKTKSVFALSNNLGHKQKVEDNSLVVLKLRNEIIASVESSWSDGSGRKNILTVWGTRGSVEFVDDSLGSSLEQKSYSSDKTGWNKLMSHRYYIPKGVEKKSSILISDSNSIRNMIDLFVDISVNNKKQKRYYKKNNMSYTVKLVKAAYKSLYENKYVCKI